MLAYDCEPHLVPVPQVLLTLAHQANASYTTYLERKTLEEAEAKQRKAEEEAAASARRQAQKDFEEGQKQLVSLEESKHRTACKRKFGRLPT